MLGIDGRITLGMIFNVLEDEGSSFLQKNYEFIADCPPSHSGKCSRSVTPV
jgi:hypothetical protein